MADAIVTPKQFESWIPVGVAISRFDASVSEASARSAILERLRAGLLRAAAKWVLDETPEGKLVRYDVCVIRNWSWFHLQNTDFWQTETADFLEVRFGGGARDKTVRCFNVRFEPAGVRQMIPRMPRAAYAPHEGGRPRKDYWDDLWIEICRQLFHGKLKPKRQVDIQKAMLAWATKHGLAMSEVSAKRRARRLFAALTKKDKK